MALVILLGTSTFQLSFARQSTTLFGSRIAEQRSK
jgi:hypothetical protein